MEPEDNNKISIKLLAIDIFFTALVVMMVFVIYDSVKQPVEGSKNQPAIGVLKPQAFNRVEIEAKAGYVFDVYKNKVIFDKNMEVQLPLASLTKLMTVLTANDLLPKDSKITIKKEFLNTEGDSGLLANESWKLEDLLDFSLIVSSNDGARSIASVVGATLLNTNDYSLGRKDFIDKMNIKAKELGLNQTYFINESGLDEENVSGGYGSAEDVGKLMQFMITERPGILDATRNQKETISSFTKEHIAKNTNTDIENIPGLIASKTGYTDMAGGNLAIAFDASIGRPIIVVVLGSSEKGRFNDVNRLVEASLEYIKE
jgi:D-alanyl-D-alanine endopeptidase (penicillin-binding protein 7)